MKKTGLKHVSFGSLDVTKQNIEKLKELFPEALTEKKIDFDKLRLILGDEVDTEPERYGFTWNGKKQSMRLAQEPTTATLKPDKAKSKNWDKTKNLYIEGDNLEVLKILQKSYASKVKMIYIDPPYNTGKDFVYKDDYRNSIRNYLEQTGQTDSQGRKFKVNSETSGRYHTDWLNMMYPRIKLAKNLLKEDGLLFISINDAEEKNAKFILNEIFGEKNFVADLIWTNKEGGGSSDTKLFRIKHEHVIVFAKDVEKINILGVEISNKDRYTEKDEFYEQRGPFYLQKLGMGSIQYSSSMDYPITMPDNSKVLPRDNNNGKKAIWRWSKEKVNWGIKNGYIIFKKINGKWIVYTKQYLKADNEGNLIKRTQRPMGIIDQFSSTQGSKELEKLNLGSSFSYPKPTGLIKYLIERVDIGNEDIVLDFFSGSGTTADAVLQEQIESNNKIRFILVQLPEKTDNSNFPTISSFAEERIRRAGNKIMKLSSSRAVNNLDTGFKVFELSKSNIKKWNNNPNDVVSQIEFLKNNFEENSKPIDVVYEIMLKQGLDLAYPIKETIYRNSVIYDIAFGAMFVVLGNEISSGVADYIIKQIAKEKTENSVIVLQDEKFVNDSEKLNTIEKLNANGIQYDDIFSI